MRRQMVCLIMIGLLASSTTTPANSDDRGERDRQAAKYDIRAERTFEGFVTGKKYILGGFVYVTAKTADARVVVQLGPREAIDRTKFVLKPGEFVVVVGVPVVLNKESVVLARVVSGMNGTLFLRDERGVRYKTPIRSEMIR